MYFKNVFIKKISLDTIVRFFFKKKYFPQQFNLFFFKF